MTPATDLHTDGFTGWTSAYLLSEAGLSAECRQQTFGGCSPSNRCDICIARAEWVRLRRLDLERMEPALEAKAVAR